MYVKSANVLSILLIIAYMYFKTRDRICLWFLSFAALIITSVKVFRKYFPDIPFGSPTIEYMVFLFIIGIIFMIFITLVVLETEKRRTKETEQRGTGFGALLTLSKDNIIFWTIIVLINLFAFLLE